MIPPPRAGGASFMTIVRSPKTPRDLGTAEAGLPKASCIEAGQGPAGWRGQHKVGG
jgi:hypothetical protein